MTIKEKIEKLFTSGYIDDHTGWFGAKDETVHMPEKVIIWIPFLNVEEAEVCFSTDHGVYSINPFYYNKKDGMMHLSTWSCGATMRSTVEQHNKENDYNNIMNDEHAWIHAEHVIEVYRDAWLKRQDLAKKSENAA